MQAHVEWAQESPWSFSPRANNPERFLRDACQEGIRPGASGRTRALLCYGVSDGEPEGAAVAPGQLAGCVNASGGVGSVP